MRHGDTPRRIPRNATFASALRLWIVMLVVAGVVGAACLLCGGGEIRATEAWTALWTDTGTPARTIVHELRLPRTVAAFGVGGLLAMAGCLMQVLVRNPLADPYTLGLSGGAAVGALGAMLAGLGSVFVAMGAGIGALITCIAVFMLAHRDLLSRQTSGQRDDTTDLILIGVVLAAGSGAIVSMMLVLAPDRDLRGMLFWMMGDLSGVAWWGIPAICLLACLFVVVPLGRQLNLLTRGEDSASALGVKPGAVKAAIFALSSIATAIAVTTAGTIGFVGLVVPHALRRLVGNDQRVLIPASAIGGGTLVVVADTLSRSIVAPIQLPVGAVMAIIGVPAFLMLLVRRR